MLYNDTSNKLPRRTALHCITEHKGPRKLHAGLQVNQTEHKFSTDRRQLQCRNLGLINTNRNNERTHTYIGLNLNVEEDNATTTAVMVHGKVVYFLPLYSVATSVTFCRRFQLQMLAAILVFINLYWLMQMTLFSLHPPGMLFNNFYQYWRCILLIST